MRLADTLKSLALVLCVISWPALAIDTSVEETTCREIGFKPKTEKFANCVLDLYERRGQTASRLPNTQKPSTQRPTQSATVGDGSQDDRTCQSYGFSAGSGGYADCRMKIDMAKRQAQTAHAQYRADLAAYEAQVAEAKKQREQDRNLRLMELGFGMMAGGGRGGSPSPVTISPPPVTPSNQNIFLPNGRIITCNTSGNVTNCF